MNETLELEDVELAYDESNNLLSTRREAILMEIREKKKFELKNIMIFIRESIEDGTSKIRLTATGEVLLVLKQYYGMKIENIREVKTRKEPEKSMITPISEQQDKQEDDLAETNKSRVLVYECTLIYGEKW